MDRRRVLKIGAGAAAMVTVGAAKPTPTPADLSGPWTAADAALILDPFHKNDYEIADLRLDPKIVAIIHKATEGMTVKDSRYATRRAEALAAGYLWGSYHLGHKDRPEDEAKRYLDIVNPSPKDLIALDLENGSNYMPLAQAARFVQTVHDQIGRYPVIYGGRNTLSQPIPAADRAVLSQCRLWIVSTRTMAPAGWPTSVWKQYTLWQFSSELRYRYPLKTAQGSARPISWDVDINYFPGGREALKAQWPLS